MGEKKRNGRWHTKRGVQEADRNPAPLHNKNLQRMPNKKGTFPKRWKKAVIIPIIKPGQEGSVEVSKYHPISLLDTGGKVLEKIMINRINHHVYSRGYMNENQYGFRPQKCAIDAAITKAFKHVSVIDMSSDRSHFTRHGFHMNSFGKERFPKQVASQIEILTKL